MVIENIKKEDLPQLLELYKTLVPFDCGLENAEKTYSEMIENEKYHLIAAKEDGQILGSMLVIVCNSLTTPFMVIEDVIVKDGMRGKGIGRQLINRVDKIAQENKCDYAILVSSSFRKGAHKFYEAMGFNDSVVGFRKVYNEEI
ncbi:MAG: GNAT family N-acetyltransferase [Clostridium sp.]|nr:GNAT family N-acetyltransferase [Clostridium sp.]